MKYFMTFSDKKLTSEVTSAVSQFQRLGMKTFKIP